MGIFRHFRDIYTKATQTILFIVISLTIFPKISKKSDQKFQRRFAPTNPPFPNFLLPSLVNGTPWRGEPPKTQSYSVLWAHVFTARVYLLRIRPELVAPTSVPTKVTVYTRNAYLCPRKGYCLQQDCLPPSPPKSPCTVGMPSSVPAKQKNVEIHIFVLKYVQNDCKSITKKN